MSLVALPDLPWRKVFGAVAVVVLHVAIAVVLLNATMVQRIFKPAPRETILYLQPLTKSQVKPTVERVAPIARRIVPVVKLQNTTGIPSLQTKTMTSPAESRPAYQRYDCRAANLPNLTDAERAACAKSAIGPKEDKGDTVDYADHSAQIPGAARWAREKARKNAPPLLPCASAQSIYATLSTATLACLAKGAINGFDPDEQQQYGDKPKDEGHVPNNGDPPPMYKDPDH